MHGIIDGLHITFLAENMLVKPHLSLFCRGVVIEGCWVLQATETELEWSLLQGCFPLFAGSKPTLIEAVRRDPEGNSVVSVLRSGKRSKK